MPPLLSFTNYLASSEPATIHTSSDSATFTACNLRHPQHPMLPYRTSTTTAAREITIDFGSARAVHVMGAFRLNFTCVSFRLAATSCFDTINYVSCVSAARNPYTGRYQVVDVPATPQTYRYMRLVFGSQDKVVEKTETAVAYYLIGGLWIGAATTAPVAPRWGVRTETIEPTLEAVPDHNGWVQRSILGDPRVRMEWERFGGVCSFSPAKGDQLADWLEIDRQSRNADLFLFYVQEGDCSQAYPVRREPPQWTVNARQAAGPWILEEAL